MKTESTTRITQDLRLGLDCQSVQFSLLSDKTFVQDPF
jgi:hypothetical protein